MPLDRLNYRIKIYEYALCSIPEISPYKELLELKRWDRLVEQFRQENYRLFQMASQSVFTVALQAGLSALKTPYPFSILNVSMYLLSYE